MGECEGNVIVFHSNNRFNQAFELMAVTVTVSAFEAAHMPGAGGLGVGIGEELHLKTISQKFLQFRGLQSKLNGSLTNPNPMFDIWGKCGTMSIWEQRC